jgi:hypothetical protein
MALNLPNTSALSGYVEPAQGRASVMYYPSTPPFFDYRIEPDLTLTTIATPSSVFDPTISPPSSERRIEPNGRTTYFYPWHKTGWQPFTWDIVRPVGDRRDPEIRLVLGRNVQMKMSRLMKDRFLRRKNAMGFYDAYTPSLTIIRPQDESLIPQPGENIDINRIIGRPYIAGPAGPLAHVERLLAGPPWWDFSPSWQGDPYTVHVTPTPTSVIIRHIAGLYEVEFGIESKSITESEPAAYAYEILAPSVERVLGFSPSKISGFQFAPQLDPEWIGPWIPRGDLLFKVRVVYSGPVYFKTLADSQDYVPFLVEAFHVYRVEDVPAQGTSLEPFFRTGSGSEYVPITLKPPPPKLKSDWITLLELGIGFIPIVGQLYSISQFAYACVTGEDFWGYKTSNFDLAALGVGALLPIALRSPQAVTVLRETLKKCPRGGKILAQTLDDGLTNQLKNVAEKELIKAIQRMHPRDAGKMGLLLTRYANGTLEAQELLKNFNNLVGKAYIREIDRRIVESVMTADFMTFKNPVLSAGFNTYAVRLTKQGTKRIADPVRWALSQRGRSRFIHELERDFGKDWRNILKRSQIDDVRLRPINPDKIAHYDKVVARGIEDYKTLAKLNKGYGDIYEVDHILEQRFWRNDPRLITAFDEKGEGFAMLVPKNPAIAAKMPGNPIAYVHTTKTRMLSDLIPNGREAEFSIQQIWDAHAFVLKALGADESSVIFAQRLKDSFRMMARARKQFPPIFRIPPSEFFRPEKNWPVLIGSKP